MLKLNSRKLALSILAASLSVLQLNLPINSFKASAQSFGSNEFNKCAKDAITLGSPISKSFGNKKISLALRYSKKCNTRWIKAFVPVGTVIRLKNNNGGVPLSETVDQYYNGSYIITDAVSDMVQGRTSLQACAYHPDPEELLSKIREKAPTMPLSKRQLKEVGQEFCTNFK
jgi:hypothetical protein